MQVIATNKEISWQSTIDRTNELKRLGAIPRIVEKEKHDDVVSSLPSSLEKLESVKSIDNLLIVTRDGRTLYDRFIDLNIINPGVIIKNALDGVYDIDYEHKEHE